MFGGLGFPELLCILLVILLLFGSDRVTDLARNLGRAVNEFKRGMSEVQSSAPPPRRALPRSPPGRGTRRRTPTPPTAPGTRRTP